ncbi:MAG: LytTR family DNA-binding domain-containing protein [Lachnospiraceae bacterium]|nr:LytTR family DNA-binding domain-containing protein [Lachnospiraceae bacterium]
MKNILLLEDNDTQRAFIKESLDSLRADISILEAGSVGEAESYIKNNTKIDLFLLDISIGEEKIEKDDKSDLILNKKGIEFAMSLNRKGSYFSVPIIFLSAHPDNIYDAVNKVHCFSFLVKPVSKHELLHQVKNACLKVNYYEIKNEDGVIIKTDINDLVYIKIKKGITTFRTVNGEIKSKHYTINQIEKNLPSHFERCFRSIIINTRYVKGLKVSDKTISFTNIDDIVPCSREYKLPID